MDSQAIRRALGLVLLLSVATACTPEEPGLPPRLGFVERTVTVSGQTFEARAVEVGLDVFDVRPVFLGRAFQELDLETDARPVVILSHERWQALGADPSILGSALGEATGRTRTIVGVADVGFGAAEEIDLFLPASGSPR